MASVRRSFVFPVWCEFQLCICPESGTLSHLQWIQSGLLPFSLSVILSLPPWGLIPPCPNTNPFSRLKTAQAAQGKGGPVSEVRLWKRNSLFLVKEKFNISLLPCTQLTPRVVPRFAFHGISCLEQGTGTNSVRAKDEAPLDPSVLIFASLLSGSSVTFPLDSEIHELSSSQTDSESLELPAPFLISSRAHYLWKFLLGHPILVLLLLRNPDHSSALVGATGNWKWTLQPIFPVRKLILLY